MCNYSEPAEPASDCTRRSETLVSFLATTTITTTTAVAATITAVAPLVPIFAFFLHIFISHVVITCIEILIIFFSLSLLVTRINKCIIIHGIIIMLSSGIT